MGHGRALRAQACRPLRRRARRAGQDRPAPLEFDELRRELDAGRPVVPQVWYRGLPGRESRPYNGDHFVVLLGYDADVVIYNDPVDKDLPGPTAE